MNDSFVYCWSDRETAKVYVGVHKGMTDDGYICSSRHMKKVHEERPQDFTRQIIATGTFADCAELEIKINRELLKDLDTCYNRCAGKAIINDAETLKLIGQKVSAFNKGKKRPPEVGQAISKAKKGKVFSTEHKEALSAAHKGKKHSPETFATRSLALKGINKLPKSKECKEKISLSVKALWENPEYRAAVMAARKAK
jgi:hypothetical protein